MAASRLGGLWTITSDASGKILCALFGKIAFKKMVGLASLNSEIQVQAERQKRKPFKTVSLGRQQSFLPPALFPLCGVFGCAEISTGLLHFPSQ